MSIQTGGVRLCNIITERNVHKYYGKEVKIQLTNNYNVDNYKTHTMLGVAAAIEDHGMTNAFPDDGPYNLNGEFFDIGTGTNISINEVKDIVLKYFPNKKFDYTDSRKGDVLFTKANTEKINNIGWKHSIGIEEGLNKCFKNIKSDL